MGPSLAGADLLAAVELEALMRLVRSRLRVGTCGLVVLVTAVSMLMLADTAIGTGNSITSPDMFDVVGRFSSLRLDAAGRPVVAYTDVDNQTIKVLHCGDPNCSSGNSVVTPDAGGDPSLALDAAGHPVVSYVGTTSGILKVLHCNDANCAPGGDSITTPDAANGVGENSSLVLDASGFPVIAYHDNSTDLDLRLMHCNDPNCAGGDESITAPDGPGSVGSSPSLVLDASGHPVVSYAGNPGLKVLHCDDPNCSPGGDSITTPDTAGSFFSLTLDAAGNPVVTYYYQTSTDLRILHCDDPNCSGVGESITSPDTAGDTGIAPSLALDVAGNPVVSYQYNTGPDRHLRVLHCIDPNCSGSNSIVTADSATWVGDDSSVRLDASGNPVVSYYDAFFKDLKVLHCSDPYCLGVKGVGGITELPNVTTSPLRTDESPGPNLTMLMASALMVAVVLGGTTWYARRR